MNRQQLLDLFTGFAQLDEDRQRTRVTLEAHREFAADFQPDARKRRRGLARVASADPREASPRARALAAVLLGSESEE